MCHFVFERKVALIAYRMHFFFSFILVIPWVAVSQINYRQIGHSVKKVTKFLDVIPVCKGTIVFPH